MTWTSERISELERLWATGASTAEIGRQLDVSKNAVVGKVHRLGLPGRPSPIKRGTRTAPSAMTPPSRPLAAAESQRSATPAMVNFRTPPCQWPFGHPGDEDFHFCGSPSLAGRPYCPEHCTLAYVREDRRDRRRAQQRRQEERAA